MKWFAQERIPFRKPAGSDILRFDLDEIVAWTRGENNGGKNNKRLLISVSATCARSLGGGNFQGEQECPFTEEAQIGTTASDYVVSDIAEHYLKLARNSWQNKPNTN